jgi:hypothetical protein
VENRAQQVQKQQAKHKGCQQEDGVEQKRTQTGRTHGLSELQALGEHQQEREVALHSQNSQVYRYAGYGKGAKNETEGKQACKQAQPFV